MAEPVKLVWDVGELVKELAKVSGKPVVVITIPFLNNDVPEYLKKLRRFEEESRNVNINVCGREYFSRSYAA